MKKGDTAVESIGTGRNYKSATKFIRRSTEVQGIVVTNPPHFVVGHQ